MGKLVYLIYMIVASMLHSLYSILIKIINLDVINQTLIMYCTLFVVSVVYKFVHFKNYTMKKLKTSMKNLCNTTQYKIAFADLFKVIFIILSIHLNGPGITLALFISYIGFTAILEYYYNGIEIKRSSMIGIAVILLGVIVIKYRCIHDFVEDKITHKISHKMIYLCLPILAGLLESYDLIKSKHEVEKNPDQHIFNLVVPTLPWIILLAIVYHRSELFNKAYDGFDLDHVTPCIRSVIYMILAVGLLAYNIFFLIYESLNHLSSTEISVLLSTAPLFTFLFEKMLLKRDIQTWHILGSVIIIIGTIMVSFNNIKKTKDQKVLDKGRPESSMAKFLRAKII